MQISTYQLCVTGLGVCLGEHFSRQIHRNDLFKAETSKSCSNLSSTRTSI
jgi:hypothetical protein